MIMTSSCGVVRMQSRVRVCRLHEPARGRSVSSTPVAITGVGGWQNSIIFALTGADFNA